MLRASDFRAILAALLFCGYALPLYVPPKPLPLAPPAFDASLIARLFPGVPGWWVLVRLACLFGAVGVVVARCRNPMETPASTSPARWSTIPPRLRLAVFTVALCHACAAPFVFLANGSGQFLYVMLMGGPALLLAISHGRAARPARWATAASVGAVMLVWLFVHAMQVYRSTWIANPTDCLAVYDSTIRATHTPGFNVVSDQIFTGISTLPLVFDGVGTLTVLGVDLSLPVLQTIRAGWLLVAAACIGYVAAETIAPSAAAIAAAAFLFSPYVMMLSIMPPGLYYGSLTTAWLAVLTVLICRKRSIPALAAFGATAGLASIHPGLFLNVLLAAICIATTLARRPRPHWMFAAMVPLSFFAVAYPSVLWLRIVPSMANMFLVARQQWAGTEAAAFGQLNVTFAEFATRAGHPHPFDALLGAFLSPVAIPRTALRLWGDVLFEPVSAALAVTGIAITLRFARGASVGAVLCAFLLATLLPGALSTYDRPSLIRVLAMPVPVALLCALGFQAMQIGEVVVSRLRTGFTIVTILVSGTALFHLVNPRILARSAIGIALDALGEASVTRAAILTPRRWDPQNTKYFAEFVPARPVRVIPFENEADLTSADRLPEIVLWSPGHEEQSSVSEVICRRWPEASIYTLSDEAGLSRAFAARISGAPWIPTLAKHQSETSDCSRPLETEGFRARIAMAKARRLLEDGHRDQAVSLLRAAASQSFVAYELLDLLSQLLLAQQPDERALLEASRWAMRACEATRYRNLELVSKLARIEVVRGALAEAARIIRDGIAVARETGEGDWVVTLERQLREVEASGS